MSFLAFAARQALGLAQASGFYLLAVTGTTLLAMVLTTFVGYVPYSDRPGPGWYGLRLGVSARELRFFIEWWAFTALGAIPAGALLFVFSAGLRAIRTPRWLLGTLCGLASLLVSMYLLLAAGWYIALSFVIVAVAGLAGFVFGTLLLPRLPISLTGSSGTISAPRIASRGALPLLGIALAGLVIVTPRPQPEQAAALAIIGCPLGDSRLTEEQGGLTLSEAEELRRLGLHGPIGVVAIITPWKPDAAASGLIQQLPIAEPMPGKRRDRPRTVVVAPTLPHTAVELDVAFSTTGLYVKRETGWTTIPNISGTPKRVRITPIRDAPGNVTVELEDVSMGTSFRYCR